MNMIETEIKNKIKSLSENNNNLLIAIDGPCAAGKTTLANILRETFNCNIIFVDDFFLQPHQRTKERLNTPGGNFDKERFSEEVLVPLKNNSAFSYRPYDCKTGTFSDPITIGAKPLTFIEGVYSCHPDLWNYYDYHIFVKTDKETQLTRLTKRNPHLLDRFISEWIPMEEKYFSTFDIQNKCDLIIEF